MSCVCSQKDKVAALTALDRRGGLRGKDTGHFLRGKELKLPSCQRKEGRESGGKGGGGGRGEGMGGGGRVFLGPFQKGEGGAARPKASALAGCPPGREKKTDA